MRTVEDGLRQIQDKAAMLRFLADAARNDDKPDERAMSGIADTCEQIQRVARQIQRALDVPALAGELGRKGSATRR